LDKETTSMAINWTQVNVPTILTVAGVAWGTISYINKLDGRIESLEKSNATVLIEMSYTKDIPFRVSAMEKNYETMVRRLDNIGEAIIQNMGAVQKDINTLGTKVEVLTSKIEDITPVKKSMLDRLEQRGLPDRN
jgi:translation initiation factor 2 alpha subunit (eIF-2alpha)